LAALELGCQKSFHKSSRLKRYVKPNPIEQPVISQIRSFLLQPPPPTRSAAAAESGDPGRRSPSPSAGHSDVRATEPTELISPAPSRPLRSSGCAAVASIPPLRRTPLPPPPPFSFLPRRDLVHLLLLSSSQLGSAQPPPSIPTSGELSYSIPTSGELFY
jgi:hypothetical protein